MNSHSKNQAAAFRKAGTELSRSSKLPFLNLTEEGAWVVGAENAPLSATRFAVDVQGAQRGFTRYAFPDCRLAGRGRSQCGTDNPWQRTSNTRRREARRRASRRRHSVDE
jgi:hypothetical protein